MMHAKKVVSTPEDWATGFAIEINADGNIWRIDMIGHRTNPVKLFTKEDRIKMNIVRDAIIRRFNRSECIKKFLGYYKIKKLLGK